ncbi:MAG TPA: hypothetical protein VG146_22600 [Verrucomicrobiae bacterium]|nr:hypothetical protein [Verrucomicrobiae bacterium]
MKTKSPSCSDRPAQQRGALNLKRPIFLALIAMMFLARHTEAANLLINPSFEQNSGHVLPIGWTRFAPPNAQTFGNYWVEPPAQSGLVGWKQWGASYLPAPTNNVAGIYQDFSSAPGSTYQAGGWFYTKSTDTLGPDCYVWMEVSFRDAGGNLLALYKSDSFSASVGTDAWFQYQVTNACDVSSPVPTGDPYFTTYAVTGTVSQLVAPIGAKTVRYTYAYLQAGSESGSCYFDSAVLDQVSGAVPPSIGSLFPQNMIFVNPSDGLTFNVSSPSGFTIPSSGIDVTLNGMDISSNLVISGSTSNKNVAYYGLQSNSTYTASITATDSFGLTASANTYFETAWVGIPPILYLWEAEDFDFTNGMYIDFPQLCDAPGNPNCYFGTVGVEGVDEHNLHIGPTHLYRPDDPMGTVISGDYLRKDHVLAGVQDYRLDPFNSGEWVNYTRDWSNATYWVIGRLSTDVSLSGSLTLSTVNPDSSTTDLGTFTIANGKGWTSFENIFLRDTNGNIANVTLNGKTTLRVTSGGNLLPNFFALVAGEIDLPILNNLYPTGAHPFEYTNALSFNVTTIGATFPAGSIKVVVDGSDVSSDLVIAGSSSSNSVAFPGLLPNAVHTAIITITNSLGHGIAVTNAFDTFSQDNFMFEAEDFDYGAGQFVTNWIPDAYDDSIYPRAQAVTNIDFQHSPISGEQFQYRSDGIPQEQAQDYLRDVFVNFGAFDYHLAWFGIGDWANYTRDYPAGTFYIYARSAGLGPYSMDLAQVLRGAGTTNQVTSHLGRWGAVGQGNQTHTWVMLTDDGLAAPALVSLNGATTLRLSTSTGLCYPNYFMLVPASGVSLSAKVSGSSVLVSVPTLAGVTYRVFYRNDLSSGNWTLLTTLLGDGTVKSITDSSTAAQRFYKVVTP